MRTSSSTTSAVCDARMPCFRYFWPWLRPFVPGRHDEAGLAAALQLGVDGGDDDVDVGDAAVGDPRLGAVEHPLVGGLVVHGPGAQAETSEPASGSLTQNAPSLTLSGVP